MTTQAVHANCLVVGTRGIVIRGRSGSGKSELTDILIEAAKNKGNLGLLVADDRVYLSSCHGQLAARAPETIAGLLEVRGKGLVKTAFLPVAKVHLLVDLKPADTIERLPEGGVGSENIDGLPVPLCACPENRPWESIRRIRWCLRHLFRGMPDYI
ncbi:HPr kinase/phosphorylase [Roseibium sp. MMSF_3412]|uniref:HPr kinase/phosphorylase n=1 Tax=Roseibium sp. MMSF_3412 TaxID=3046712 RepID=UPI00273EFF1D|nr:HPr kinase/phosphatase C-terminal domain-containing protein [Roseibium sp. MMSF_3412]